jgi:hypothetical protein
MDGSIVSFKRLYVRRKEEQRITRQGRTLMLSPSKAVSPASSFLNGVEIANTGDNALSTQILPLRSSQSGDASPCFAKIAPGE